MFTLTLRHALKKSIPILRTKCVLPDSPSHNAANAMLDKENSLMNMIEIEGIPAAGVYEICTSRSIRSRSLNIRVRGLS